MQSELIPFVSHLIEGRKTCYLQIRNFALVRFYQWKHSVEPPQHCHPAVLSSILITVKHRIIGGVGANGGWEI